MLMINLQVTFSAVVAAITGLHLQQNSRGSSSLDLSRFIYTEAVAGLSILSSLLWLLPFSRSFTHWPTDLLLSVCWFIAFGLIVSYLDLAFEGRCGNPLNWSQLGPGGCGSWKADEAFALLSAFCWLISGVLGFRWVRKYTEEARTAAVAPTARARWYRRSRV